MAYGMEESTDFTDLVWSLEYAGTAQRSASQTPKVGQRTIGIKILVNSVVFTSYLSSLHDYLPINSAIKVGKRER